MWHALWPQVERRTERLDLGVYEGRALAGHVRHTGVRIAWAGRQLLVSRASPARLEVFEGGNRTVVEVPRPRDPRALLLVATLVLLLASFVATAVARRGGPG